MPEEKHATGPLIEVQLGRNGQGKLQVHKTEQYVIFSRSNGSVFRSQTTRLALHTNTKSATQTRLPNPTPIQPETSPFVFKTNISGTFNFGPASTTFKASPPPRTGPFWRYYCHNESLYVFLKYKGKHYYFKIQLDTSTAQLISERDYTQNVTAPPPCDPHLNNRRANHSVSDVREKMISKADFHIECNDNVRIPVHSLIMQTYWPWFDTMMQSDFAEVQKKVLKLDYPSDWIEVVVSYVYGQTVEMTFEQATGLVVVAEMYQLPELAKMASDEIMKAPRDAIALDEAVLGWKRAHEARNEPVKAFLARNIAHKKPQIENNDDDKRAFEPLCQKRP